MGIELVKIRAVVSVGNLDVETPFIQSFNVQKTRGQISTFSAQLKVDSDQLSGGNVGGLVSIKAGGNGTMRQIYTGILKKSTITPCWDDPGYVMWNISGEDSLSLLGGKKYTRRCRATKFSWVTINSVVRKGLRSGKFDAEADILETNSGASVKDFEVKSAPLTAQGQGNRPPKQLGSDIVEVSLVATPDSEGDANIA
jgi:hypothetical protein